MSTKAVIFSGSFNPVHIGHTAIANYVIEFAQADEVWFIVSPQNPFKVNSGLLDFEHRFNMAKLALKGLDLPIIVSDVEEALPKPSYTINTLETLTAKYPDKEWSLLIGSDNLVNLHNWRDYDKIATGYQLLVYPRLGYDNKALYAKHNAIKLDAPIIEISSTFIREALQKGYNLNGFIHPDVSKYIKKHKLYLE